MSEFFIQEKHLSRATRTVIKNESGKSIFLMVGRWGTKGLISQVALHLLQ